MSAPNIGWLYYKDYHQTNGNQVSFFMNAPMQKGDFRDNYFQQHYEQKNAVILSKPFDANVIAGLQIVPAIEKLCFNTIYPGLTLGTGYTHETGELGEFKLGFFFDHSTGYPCIPGSSVKGCLRGMFPQNERNNVADKPEKYDYLASVIRELHGILESSIVENELGKDFDKKESSSRKRFIDILEREIFESEKPERNEDGNYKMKDGEFVFQPLCLYERDIFFDGYIVSTNHPAINRSTYQNPKPFIGDDYITPHQNRKKPEMSPFTNPVPIMFLKILPEVTIQFQFDVKDGLLTKVQKEELFRNLLLDFGIGAKTNVGYGQFEPPNNSKSLKSSSISKSNDFKLTSERVDEIPVKAIQLLKKDCVFKGKMIDKQGLNNFYSFIAGGVECVVRKKTDKNPDLKLNDPVEIVFNQEYISGEIPNFKVRFVKK